MEYQDQGLIRQNMSPSGSFRVILFDLGGVLLKLRDPVSTFGLEPDDSEFFRTWAMSPAVRAHESGQISADEFAQRIVTELGLKMDWQELLRRFDQWPESIYPEAVDILSRIPSQYACAILSNINSIHWARIDIPRNLADRINRYFLSFETGLLKPDGEAFLQVAESYDCTPPEILFFDDNPVNVAAAAQAGITAVRTEGPEELEAALVSAGVI